MSLIGHNRGWNRFKIRGAGIVVKLGRQICLQRRTLDADSRPGELTHWGGEVEGRETARIGGSRELQEELSLLVPPRKLIYLKVHCYQLAVGPSLAARFFIALPENTEIDCKEGAPEFYDTVSQALAAPKIDPIGTTWALKECARRGLAPA